MLFLQKTGSAKYSDEMVLMVGLIALSLGQFIFPPMRYIHRCSFLLSKAHKAAMANHQLSLSLPLLCVCVCCCYLVLIKEG